MTANESSERVREMLEAVVDALDLDADVVVEDDGETITGTLVGDSLGLAIGRHGQTIDALQHLAFRIAAGGSDERRRVVIDAGGYRERRASVLHRQADQAADDATQFERPVSLDAMGAAERRLVHEYLRDRSDVETYSEGAEPARQVVVAPLDAGAAATANTEDTG